MKDIIQILLLVAILGLVLNQRQAKQKTTKNTRKLVLDTCALIDGRILELSKSGFVPEELIVPEFILHELQMLADGSDSHKRERARYGLDVVRELQDSNLCTVTIDHTQIGFKDEVDDKLVALAKHLGAQLYTTDYNLNKVADIEGVRVLNVNELAQNLRPIAIPGERQEIKIMQRGSNPQQGVGYLEDGTMVVVDGGAKYLGKKLAVEITRIHQTVAGKMLFAQLIPRELPRETPTVARQQSSQQHQTPKTTKATTLRRRLRPRNTPKI